MDVLPTYAQIDQGVITSFYCTIKLAFIRPAGKVAPENSNNNTSAAITSQPVPSNIYIIKPDVMYSWRNKK